MSAELDEVLSTIAALHGLTESAAGFLVGSNLEELEASAGALGRLIGEQVHSEPEPTNIFAAAHAEKLRQRRVLVDALTGRPGRDERGRFAPRGGFDGGARSLAPRAPATGVQLLAEHGRWVAEVVRGRRADQGVHF